MKKKTVVIGASDNPERYAYKATKMLLQHQHEVVPVGLREGTIEGIRIENNKPALADVDTVSLYVGPAHQEAWKDYILSLHPKRIILNPGTEGGVIQNAAAEHNIEALEACTLVLLSTGQF